MDIVVWVLLAIAASVSVICCLSLLFVRGVYDQLHFTAPASVIPPVTIAIAIIINQSLFSQSGAKAVIVAVLIGALNPILIHATARAARYREHGRWQVSAEELGREPRR